jgi:acetoacetyl-CoA synthetase
MCSYDAAEMSAILWSPDPERAARSQLAAFMRTAGRETDQRFDDYAGLWQWSVDEPAAFWGACWRFFEVIGSPYETELEAPDAMPGACWFPGAHLNFAENLLRFRDDRTALVFRTEDGDERPLSYVQLYGQAGGLAAALQAMGVGPGDRVAAVLPNMPEAVVGMLATSWLGAVWSSCSPDFGSDGIVDRFGQIEPSVLIASTGYSFKGRSIDIRDKVRAVFDALPGCRQLLAVDWPGIEPLDGAGRWDDVVTASREMPPFSRQPFDHPLYILFSSGTTGRPKCIVHGVGGTLLQHLKEHRLHVDLQREDVLFYYTTCGWMMWNWLVSGLATGATLVLFDGNPFHPKPETLWELADEVGVTVFGTSAKYISALDKAGVRIVDDLPLRALRTVLSTGSPLAPESFDYLHDAIKPDLQISSISGGTDIVSCFALGNPLLPVYRGELQCRGLGMAVDVFDAQGQSVRNEPGELVCIRPFPSMPVGFWGDADGSRFRAAYFERFPGVWTHGDWTVLNDHGGLVISGRSDAVLNPGGVRIGTAEIYRQVEKLPEIRESVCIGQCCDDDVRVVLFVVLELGAELDEALRTRIRRQLREHASPRHVPAKILAVDDIPRTRSGKISELAVRDTVEGRPVANTAALANPEVLAQYRGRPELAES